MEKKIHFNFKIFFSCWKYAGFGNIFRLTRLSPKLLMKYRESLSHFHSFWKVSFICTDLGGELPAKLLSRAKFPWDFSHLQKLCVPMCRRPVQTSLFYLVLSLMQARDSTLPQGTQWCSDTFLCLTHIPPHQDLFCFYSEHGQAGHQYLLLKFTHLGAKMFASFWCCFSFEFADMVQPSFREFAKLSTYSISGPFLAHLQEFSIMVLQIFSVLYPQFHKTTKHILTEISTADICVFHFAKCPKNRSILSLQT